jgi:hypothetical protein
MYWYLIVKLNSYKFLVFSCERFILYVTRGVLVGYKAFL